MHVVYQVGLREPDPLKVQQWPSSINLKDKEAIIAARKQILRDFMDFIRGKNGDFMNQYGTDDVEWEDPIERIKGFNEVEAFAKLTFRWINVTEIDVISENHSPHEIIMDWKFKTTWFSLFNFPFGLRTHIMIEPSKAKVGGPEM